MSGYPFDPPGRDSDGARIAGLRRDVEWLKKRPPGGGIIGEWIVPTLINGWVNAGSPFADIAYRVDGEGDTALMLFRGHITGGSSGTIAFYVDPLYWPDDDLSTITDVVTVALPGAAQIYVRASDGAVILTTIV
jgi:hypothetical protein